MSALLWLAVAGIALNLAKRAGLFSAASTAAAKARVQTKAKPAAAAAPTAEALSVHPPELLVDALAIAYRQQMDAAKAAEADAAAKREALAMLMAKLSTPIAAPAPASPPVSTP